MTLAQPTLDSLWDLLALGGDLRRAWQHSRLEADRLAMRASWEIHIGCPGYHDRPEPGHPGRCTSTVLSRDTGGASDHIAYRGACLGCGWVAERAHLVDHYGENGAVEDALDHTHPGWRHLPVVGPLPFEGSGPSGRKAIQAWRARFEPLLPAGWLDAGGPVRTPRARYATRHVPGRAPGGGYDTATPSDDPEAQGGQLVLFG